ncbi:unnamed protein product [Phyllotreta striolata]|uniref:protein-tyrosine-phosphatase n=1 Tax=Phyllotreta striolata TaxID=444603 RepID=A0A9N9TNW1_PHYSR|nr:unnamed protein product [Phyllotreta striolata]
MEELSPQPHKERNFPTLDLSAQTLDAAQQPVLIVQSPKTPTLSKKLKAVSLDSDPPSQSSTLDLSRDVFSMPNTPKKHPKTQPAADLGSLPSLQKANLAPTFNSNLKKFASNNSISGSQTLKTLPEIKSLHDFTSEGPVAAPARLKKGLLERRGSNVSLTIDLGSNPTISESKPANRLVTAKSVSNLDLSKLDACTCSKSHKTEPKEHRKSSQEACVNCTIDENRPNNIRRCTVDCPVTKRCRCCANSRRKSLSNENLYVPPCVFCHNGAPKEPEEASKRGREIRRACYPRQTDLDLTHIFSEDFVLHVETMQYLQTATNTLSVDDLKRICQDARVIQQEFWQVPLNIQNKCCVSGSQSLNRYKEVFPNEYSRVHLPGSQQYIHANYIKGPDYTETVYIATQGPMAHTCKDFWEMVWTTNCKCIVMLTGLVEKGSSKCDLYFPLGKKDDNAERSFHYVKTTKVRDKFTFDMKYNTQQYEEEIHRFEERDEVTFGNYRITYVSEIKLKECTVRQLKVKRSDSDPRVIYHYWVSNWPDHKMTCPKQVLEMALDVLDKMHAKRKSDNKPNISKRSTDESLSHSTNFKSDLKAKSWSDSSDSIMTKKDTMLVLKGTPEARRKSIENLKAPVVVHCSAGIGRTGCFLAILNGIQQLRESGNVDVLGILCSLRMNRGGMVQTVEQYELIYRVLSLYAESMT